MAMLIFISQHIRGAAIARKCIYKSFNVFDNNIGLCVYQSSNELTLRLLHDAPKIHERYNNYSKTDHKSYYKTRKNHDFRKEDSFSNRLRYNSYDKSQTDDKSNAETNTNFFKPRKNHDFRKDDNFSNRLRHNSYYDKSQTDDISYPETNTRFFKPRENHEFRKEDGFSNRLRPSREYQKPYNGSYKRNSYNNPKPHVSRQLSHNTPKLFGSSESNAVDQFEASTPYNDDANSIPDDDISDNLIYADDPDSFGMLSHTNVQFTEKYEHDEDDKKEEEFLHHIPSHKQKLSTKKYADMIKDHIQHKRIKEALDVMEERMIKEDRVQPENYIYNILIDGCARVGYTKKAFKLFNDLKKRGLKVTGATYTSLFNACANSPWSEDGLRRANNLRLLMTEKGEEPNLTNYNSMIKAFGRCGDIETAFAIVDEMASKKMKIRVHTFNFLLQACISHKDRGFQYALTVWKTMLTKKEKPNVYSFNLMLKCIKECKFGETNADHDTLKALCLPIDTKNIRQLAESAGSKDNMTLELLDDSISSQPNLPVNDETVSEIVTTSESKLATPCINLLSQTPNTTDLVSLQAIKTVDDRMSMVGGYLGFLKEMDGWGVQPDLKTLTQLLIVAPNTTEAENKLLMIKKFLKTNVDIGFYNMLIKRRCYRLDYDSAKEVRKLIEDENKYQVRQTYWKSKTIVAPDILTYGLMALYCVTKNDAIELLNEMTTARLRLNSEILGTLLRHGTANNDIEYVLFIMNYTKTEQVDVNEVYFSHLENFYIKCKAILRGEQMVNGNPPPPSFEVSFKKFKKEFKKLTKTEKPEEEHPWSQFKSNQPETFQRPTVIPKPVRFYKREIRRIPKYVVKA